MPKVLCLASLSLSTGQEGALKPLKIETRQSFGSANSSVCTWRQAEVGEQGWGSQPLTPGTLPVRYGVEYTSKKTHRQAAVGTTPLLTKKGPQEPGSCLPTCRVHLLMLPISSSPELLPLGLCQAGDR